MEAERPEGEAALSREIPAGAETRREVRAPVVARKPRKRDGAKGCRKADAE